MTTKCPSCGKAHGGVCGACHCEKDDLARECPICRHWTPKGSRCEMCRWPDPETQPKQYAAWLRRAAQS